MRPRAILISLLLLLLAVGALWLVNRVNAPKRPSTGSDEPDIETLRKSLRQRSTSLPRTLSAPASSEPAQTNRLSRLARLFTDTDAWDEIKLTPEQVDVYLARSGRSAESLLAAARLASDPALLREAAEKYPGDPRVQFAMLTANTNTLALSPEDRRKWLEGFKQSSPDNSLPALLSAREYFKTGQPELAVKELAGSGGGRRYHDYTLEAVQNTEEAYLSAGWSPAEAKTVAMTSALLTQLPELNGLGKNLVALEQQYRAAGDTVTADGLMMTGIQIGQRLAEGPSPTLLQELVANAVERRFLSNASPALIDGPARLAQLDARRQAIRQAASGAGLEQFIQSGDEATITVYFDRQKIYGEYNALMWLKQRQTNAP